MSLTRYRGTIPCHTTYFILFSLFLTRFGVALCSADFAQPGPFKEAADSAVLGGLGDSDLAEAERDANKACWENNSLVLTAQRGKGHT